jgi:hypothetical protein
MLAYGGLVASRRYGVDLEEAQRRLRFPLVQGAIRNSDYRVQCDHACRADGECDD